MASINFRAKVGSGPNGITDIHVQFRGALERPVVTYDQPSKDNKIESFPLPLQNPAQGAFIANNLDVALKIKNGIESIDGYPDDVMIGTGPNGEQMVDVIFDPGTPAYKELSKKLAGKKRTVTDVFGDDAPDLIFTGCNKNLHVVLGIKGQDLPPEFVIDCARARRKKQ